MPSSRTSRKVAAFFGEDHTAWSVINALALDFNPTLRNRMLSRSGRLPSDEVWVEKRVVASHNSDCRPYSFAEFQEFFGPELARSYWHSALRLRASTTTSHSVFGDIREADEALEPTAASRGVDRLSPRLVLR